MAPVCSELVESGVIVNRDGRVWAEQARWGQSGPVCMCRFHFSEASPDRLLHRGPGGCGGAPGQCREAGGHETRWSCVR